MITAVLSVVWLERTGRVHIRAQAAWPFLVVAEAPVPAAAVGEPSPAPAVDDAAAVATAAASPSPVDATANGATPRGDSDSNGDGVAAPVDSPAVPSGARRVETRAEKARASVAAADDAEDAVSAA
jgi:hypothetical protein